MHTKISERKLTHKNDSQRHCQILMSQYFEKVKKRRNH